MSLYESEAPYLTGCSLVSDNVEDPDVYPFHLPCVAGLDLRFTSAVTFFVGENGSGKSTILEAIAGLCGLPVNGGGLNDTADVGEREASGLADALRPRFRRKPRDSFFFRAETLIGFSDVLEARAQDPSFGGDPYAIYGGKPLQHQSHGEGFLSVMSHRLRRGLYLFDEPEAALSPQRQLSFLMVLDEKVQEGAQFIIATHSPILLTYPDATILSFDDGPPERVDLEETEHYQLTRSILNAPGRFWRQMRG